MLVFQGVYNIDNLICCGCFSSQVAKIRAKFSNKLEAGKRVEPQEFEPLSRKSELFGGSGSEAWPRGIDFWAELGGGERLGWWGPGLAKGVGFVGVFFCFSVWSVQQGKQISCRLCFFSGRVWEMKCL